MPADSAPPIPFRIKICGITTPAEVAMVSDAGADAVGLNFYPKSRRALPIAQRQAVLEALESTQLTVVGLFVNASLDEIRAIATACSLDWIQLHGDEPDAWIRELGPHRVLRAIRWPIGGRDEILARLEHMAKAETLPAAILLDAGVPGQFGGTGQSLPWDEVSPPSAESGAWPLPWVLAGGLNPRNVGDAIRCCRPPAIDTASGVERPEGGKDPRLLKAFVQQANQAWAESPGPS